MTTKITVPTIFLVPYSHLLQVMANPVMLPAIIAPFPGADFSRDAKSGCFIEQYPVESDFRNGARKIIKIDRFHDVAVHTQLITFDSVPILT